MNSTTTATSTRRVLGVDRRKPSDRPMSRDMARIRNEYVEMPGLVLTLPQAARLWSLSESRSELLLSLLVEAGFLICDKKTVYRRRLDRSEKGESDAPSAVVYARNRQAERGMGHRRRSVVSIVSCQRPAQLDFWS